MRALGCALVAGSTIVGAAILTHSSACAPFGSAPSDDDRASLLDAAADGAPSSSDDAGPAQTIPDAGANAICLDFTQDTHGATLSGNATHGPGGIRLEIGGGATSRLRRTFTLPGSAPHITRSVVSVRAITTAEAATWEDGAYLDLLAQYLGDTTSYASAPAMELELLRSSLELNVWHAPDKFDDTYVIQTGALTTSDSPVVSQIATSWPEGKTTVSLPGQDFPFATRATSTSTTRFTVVLGGTSHAGSTPKIVVTVQTLCVALE